MARTRCTSVDKREQAWTRVSKGVHTAPGGLSQLLNKIAPLTAMSIAPGGPPPSPYIRAWLRAQRWPLLSSFESGSSLSRNFRSPYRTGRGPSLRERPGPAIPCPPLLLRFGSTERRAGEQEIGQ
eukprot:scaffold61115_cov62-Phaeocystis_antarctica.AAC.5